jgi:hypothetical protein
VDKIKLLHDRKSITLSDEQTSEIEKCFADLDLVKDKLIEYSSKSLTPKGSALLAERVNYSLDRDQMVAFLINANVIEKRFTIPLYTERLCESYYQDLITKLNLLPEVKSGLDSIIQFIKSNCPQRQ